MIATAKLKQVPAMLFDPILDRTQTEMPDYYLPSATHVSIAGPTILNALGYVSGGALPAGWKRGTSGFSKRSSTSDRMLWVQRCGRYWIIERSVANQPDQDQALVCAFSGNPIWSRTMASAMLVAEHCDPLPTSVLAACWIPIGT
ncbi:hypothetical protein [Bradyrhizobium genosp. P]|uniref:hypothetical protein n=1 Tax=Bradyrhizobium genosp. P TaxID=83641 RepID=UPI003CF1BD28